MLAAPTSPQESERLSALQSYGVLDTPPEAAFDEVARLAARICETPMALVLLIDADRLWFKARHGLAQTEVARDGRFFGPASDQPDELLVVPDATRDARFAGSLLVLGEPGIVFYAGFPLRTRTGLLLGTLCVMDRRPRTLTADQQDALGVLGRQVMNQLELRRSLHETGLHHGRLENSQRIAGLGDWEHDFVNHRLLWSEELYRIFGLVRKDNPPDSAAFYRLVHPDDLAFVRREKKAAAEEFRRVDFEHRIIRPDGEVRYLHHIAEMLVDDQGQPVRESGTIQDITERQHADEALRQSEERYRLMFEHNPSPMWVFDPKTLEFLAVNDATVALYGYSRAEFMRLSALDIRPPETAPEFLRHVATAATEFRASVRYLHRKKYGTVFPVDVLVHGVNFAGRSARLVLAVDMTEAEHAASALRASEGRFRTLSESAPLGIFETDATGRVVYYNPTLIALTGRPATASFGGGWLENLHPDDRAAMSAGWARATAAGSVWDQEQRVLRPDGSECWVHTLAAPSRDADGRITGFVGTVEDVTQRRAAKAALLESEERYRKLLQLSPDAHFVYVDGLITLVNRAFCQLMGAADPAQLLGRPALGVPQPGYHVLVNERQQEAFNDQPALPAEMKFVRFDGTTVDVEVSSVAYDFRGRKEVQVIARNITTRKRTVAALRESEERFKLVARAVSDVVWDWDLATNQLWWGDGFLTTFGYAADEIEPGIESWTSRIHPDEHGTVYESIRRAIDHDAESWTADYRFRRKDGTYAFVQDRGYILRDAAGKGVRMVGGMRDLTEQKKMEARYLRAQRMESIGTLAGGIAHDLNNVLAPILMSIELLKLNAGSDPKRSHILDTIYVSCRRGADLVHQVLSFARGVDGQRVAIRLRHQIGDLEGIISETFPRNIQIVTEVADDLWPITGDPTQLHQVLLNLAVNARDAMPSGGTLTLAAINVTIDLQYAGTSHEASAGPHVLLQIIDTGLGIPPEVRDRIFEPFFTTKALGQGTGLGLATVHAIVQSHGGFLSVDSEVGRGTTFKVYLPADPALQTTATQNPFPVALPHGRGELALVVDDEFSIRDITQKTLEAFGYRVLTARDGAEAVALYTTQAHEIAIVITDMMMPVMDGSATIAALRRLNPSVRIIAASGLEVAGNVIRATGAGVKDFLVKPFTAETLLKLVREVLDRPAAPRN